LGFTYTILGRRAVPIRKQFHSRSLDRYAAIERGEDISKTNNDPQEIRTLERIAIGRTDQASLAVLIRRVIPYTQLQSALFFNLVELR
jgi:hypothetical protein